MTPSVSVEILDVPQAAACCTSGCCGPSWSSAEIAEMVREELHRRFDDKVTLAYLDVKDKTVSAERGSLIDSIEDKGLLYPVTVIDGEPVFDGSVSFPMILRTVTRILEGADGQ